MNSVVVKTPMSEFQDSDIQKHWSRNCLETETYVAYTASPWEVNHIKNIGPSISRPTQKSNLLVNYFDHMYNSKDMTFMFNQF